MRKFYSQKFYKNIVLYLCSDHNISLPFIENSRNHIEFNRINSDNHLSFFLNHGCHHNLNMIFFPSFFFPLWKKKNAENSSLCPCFTGFWHRLVKGATARNAPGPRNYNWNIWRQISCSCLVLKESQHPRYCKLVFWQPFLCINNLKSWFMDTCLRRIGNSFGLQIILNQSGFNIQLFNTFEMKVWTSRL